jgi:ribonucleotide reductase alpha subunit
MRYGEVEFNLTDNFLSKFKGKQPKWGPLGYFTYKRTYARTLESGKTEEFWQTLQRVTEGTFVIQKNYCKHYHLPWNDRKSQHSAQEMFRRMWEFKFLPPGRGLWAMGSDFVFEKGSAPLYNCGFVSTENINTDFAEPFTWLMDMSMMGVGVGFDTLGSDRDVYLKSPRRTADVHTCEDSREGWVNGFSRVLAAFAGNDTLPSSWDYSKIRDAGEPIRGFGGVAPGPDPLSALIERTIHYLDRYVEEDKPVDSTCIVDLMNFAGAAVVAGGIRRTSEIAFGAEDDEEFLNLKSQENLNDKGLARWASNNSIQVNKYTDFSKFVDHTAANGEPGFVWLSNCQKYGRMKDEKNHRDYRVRGLNPCGEITLESYELCNIAETFPSRHDTLEDYLATLKYVFLYGKTVTLLPTHQPKTNQVQMRNRRIGISQSGIVENVNKIGPREHLNWCEAGYQRIKELDLLYSEWLCIPNSKKLTTVKPSGTVSLLPGTTPGIHFPHSEYYIRRLDTMSSLTRTNPTTP